MTARLAILNGPTLNLLDVVEPHICGCTLAFHRSNHEGVPVDRIPPLTPLPRPQ